MTAIVMRGDARALPLPDESVDLICTSPPYFGQRDYRDDGESMAGQIGAEATPQAYVAALLDCTREWMRAIKPTGSIFVNLSDKYGPDKSLMGLPARYEIGCMDALGLILRRDIVWHKKSGAPESAADRCTTSHEYLFHFTVRPHYYSAADEIREPHAAPGRKAGRTAFGARNVSFPRASAGDYAGQNPLGKIPGSVWEMCPQPLAIPGRLGVTHLAAFPASLPRRCILGWSPTGICTACGEGRRPVVSKAGGRPVARSHRHLPGYRDPAGEGVRDLEYRITGYACDCEQPTAPVRPAVVVDPFGGTGTTALVADVFGRTGISVDLSMDYCRLARWRTTDPGERAKAMQVPKPPPVPEGQGDLFSLEAS